MDQTIIQSTTMNTARSTLDIIRARMREVGMTHQRLADLIGEHRPAITRWLSGRVQPPSSVIDRMLAALGMEVTVTRDPTTPGDAPPQTE